MGRIYIAFWETDMTKAREVCRLEKEGKIGIYPKGVKSLGNWVTPDLKGVEILEVEDEKALFEYISQYLPWMKREDVYPALTPKEVLEILDCEEESKSG